LRAYIVIGALAVLAISTGIYVANTQIEQAPPGYRWAEQRGIDDEDYCPDGNKLSYEGCVPSGTPYEADNGKGVPQPLNPDDDDDDNGKRRRGPHVLSRSNP
jgi:hypothetical protein